jgi:hypothetical protein
MGVFGVVCVRIDFEVDVSIGRGVSKGLGYECQRPCLAAYRQV